MPHRAGGGWFQTLLALDAGQADGVKSFFQFAVGWMLLCLPALNAPAAFTSLYAFGDGVCTTTNNTSPGVSPTNYYGTRFCNGRVWLEVLAERQGLAYVSNRNWSYFGHDSTALTNNVNAFVAPPDASTALLVVWANDADFVFFITQFNANAAALPSWTNAMNRSLTNHFRAIQTLYNKGVRTLIMPNAVDLTKVPFFVQSPPADKAFIRQRIMDYNAAFAARLALARVTFTNLVIHAPDTFALFDDIIARSSAYGLTNKLLGGFSIDAIQDPSLTDKSLNGPGANYIFWDYLDPTAKVQEILADTVQNVVSPPRVHTTTAASEGVQLQLTDLPVGLNGILDGSTNFLDWASAASFNSTNVTQSVLVPVGQTNWFYRLRFPFAWSWP